MKLPVNGRSARFAWLAATLIPALALGACGGAGGGLASAVDPASALGPRGDYPVVVGEPYAVAGTTYTPEDVLNYDEVGFLAADLSGGDGVTGSHHTLPLPSYVEVTSLETGRTVVVRIERRGPMDGHEILGLSPGALAQLEANAGAPVRVRRVNPPEEQRALLRVGNPAEPRMDTPMSLVEILKRKLPDRAARAAPSSAQTSVAVTPHASAGDAAAVPPSDRAPSVAQGTVTQEGAFMVQAAAFSTAERARRAAQALNGTVTQAGRYFRVRTGPFATHGEAEASLAKVRAAGYTDARILTNG